MNLFRPSLCLTGLVFLMLATAACNASPLNRPWVQADLRALNAQAAPSPATDILAVYTRTTDLSVDVRVDLLDINPGDQYSLKLILWDNRDFQADPLVIDISSDGTVQTSGIDAGKAQIWPRVVQDTDLDFITVSLNRFLIGARYRLDVFTSTSDPNKPDDEVLNVRSDGKPPAERAPLLLAFWDTFPATTPTQTLRRWAGAHTGPLGDRHGLKYILDGVKQTGIPVALLDLKNPASLAALNFLGNLQEIQDMYAGGLLILPDVAYGEPTQTALGFSRAADSAFLLPSSPFLYETSSDQAALSGYAARFQQLPDSHHVTLSGGIRLIPVPSLNAVEAGADGPSMEVRRALIAAATSVDPTDLVVLGGSLPASTWGDANMAGPTFAWIAAHPWIQPLTGQELLTFPAQPQEVATPPAPARTAWLGALQAAPENAITQSAWQTYFTLTSATPDALLQSLRSAYLGQVGELLAAANWANKPAARADCTQDLNGDGQAECILANQGFFAVLETAGARLTQFFALTATGPHQLVGPSFQFAVGLSDPSEWHPERGEAADPNGIPGAFTDASDTWIIYTPSVGAGGITFTSPDGSRSKTYRLIGNGIQVDYQGQGPVSTRIPLAVDPQAFYGGPTHFHAALGPASWTWGLSGGSSVEVSTNAALSAQGFISAIPYLSLLEDPNLDYPQGDYLPFPLSVVTIQADGNFSVQIIRK